MFVKIPHTYFNTDSPVVNLSSPEECRVISCKFTYQGKKYGFYETIPTTVYKEYLFMYLRHMVHRKHEIIESVNILNLHYMEAFGTTYEPSKKPFKDYWLEDSE